jgi:3-carboxy-cis,cis-muconate cycloisomerase
MTDPRDALYTTPAMAAVFSPAGHLRQLLAFEAALARAEARAGLIPLAAAEAIAAACEPRHFDVADLFTRAATAGTLAIPLVHDLTARVAPAGRDFVHWGATSQDAIDTALVLQMRAGLDLLVTEFHRLAASCAHLAHTHRHTLMAGRTLLQHALPITFGLKAGRWLALIVRQIHALNALRPNLVPQLGGAAGTLAALGDHGLLVADLLADELALAPPDLPWHTERDRLAAIGAALGVAAGSLAKIAQDILLLSQSEVGEASEAAIAGKGISSAMPQKRNPLDATLALAASRLALGQVPIILGAMAQEHERAAGAMQIEWQATHDLFRYAAGAAFHVAEAVTGLHVNPERMAANLELSGGLLMAESLMMLVAPQLGRSEAQRLVRAIVERAQRDGIPFREAAGDDQELQAALVAAAGHGGDASGLVVRALDPAGYLGSAEALIDRALAAYAAIAGQR